MKHISASVTLTKRISHFKRRSNSNLNYIKFKRNGSFILKKLKLPKKQINYLNKNLFLIYTGIHRYSNDVEKDKILNFDKNLIHLDQIKKIA